MERRVTTRRGVTRVYVIRDSQDLIVKQVKTVLSQEPKQLLGLVGRCHRK